MTSNSINGSAYQFVRENGKIVRKRKKVLLKLIMIGDAGVGKTSIMNSYMYKYHHRPYKSTIGVDFLSKDIILDDDTIVTIQIWDTAGQERFLALGPGYYRGADGCIIVYDKSNQNSFKSVESWKDECLKETAPRCPTEFPFMLLANKYDLINDEKSRDLCEWDMITYDRLTLTVGYCRKIEQELMNGNKNVSRVHIPYDLMNLCSIYVGNTRSGELYAEGNGMLFYNVSAKTHYNLEQAFHNFAQKAIEYEEKYSSGFDYQTWRMNTASNDGPSNGVCYCY